MKNCPTVEKVLRSLLSEIVAYPDTLDITSELVGRSGTVNIAAGRADTPRLIGKGGRQFRAICAIARNIGKANGLFLRVNRVKDPVGGKAEKFDGFEPVEDWPKEKVTSLLQLVCDEVFKNAVVEHNELANDVTSFAVVVDQDTSGKLVEEMTEALVTTFDAIGKKNGREITVGIIPDLPVDRQPD